LPWLTLSAQRTTRRTTGRQSEFRKGNGHPKPFNLKCWSVGNERYDKECIHRVRDTAKEMKRLYPDLLVTGSGAQDGMKRVDGYLMEQPASRTCGGGTGQERETRGHFGFHGGCSCHGRQVPQELGRCTDES
jgi:hypothetical protein